MNALIWPPPRCVAAALAAVLSDRGAAAPAAADDQAIVHVLNRIGFGPRPGDIERVAPTRPSTHTSTSSCTRSGLPTQRSPRGLSGLTTLTLSSREIAERYEIPRMQARREREAGRGQQRRTPDQAPSDRAAPTWTARAAASGQLPLLELSQQKILRAVYSERQLQEVLTDFWFNHFNVDARKGPERVHADRVRARRRSVRTCSAASAICSARRRRARRCSSISTTG